MERVLFETRDEPVEKIVIKTGSVTLNRALGVGGFLKAELWKFMGQNHLQKLLWLSML